MLSPCSSLSHCSPPVLVYPLADCGQPTNPSPASSASDQLEQASAPDIRPHGAAAPGPRNGQEHERYATIRAAIGTSPIECRARPLRVSRQAPCRHRKRREGVWPSARIVPRCVQAQLLPRSPCCCCVSSDLWDLPDPGATTDRTSGHAHLVQRQHRGDKSHECRFGARLAS